LDLCVKGVIFLGGYPQICQDTRIILFITRSFRDPTEKVLRPSSFSGSCFFLWFVANWADRGSWLVEIERFRRARFSVDRETERAGRGELLEMLTTGGCRRQRLESMVERL
jgi:hypothetical protein